jgi:hypothetical protein
VGGGRTTANRKSAQDSGQNDVGGAGGGEKQDAKYKAKIAAHLVEQILAEHANDPNDPKLVGPTLFLPDFDVLAERRAIEAELAPTLQAKYGVGPNANAYDGLLDAPEARNKYTASMLSRALVRVVAAVNQRLKESGSAVVLTEEEVAVNCLSEGAIVYVRGRRMTHAIYKPDGTAQELQGPDVWIASGVNDVDKLMPRIGKLLPEGFDLNSSTFETAFALNAAVYATMIPTLIRDIGPERWAKLPPEAQFYWKTVYYNRGEGKGRKYLHNEPIDGDVPGEQNTHGIDAWKFALTQADGEQNVGNAKYNAAWRTLTFEMVTKLDAVGPQNPEGTNSRLLPSMQLSLAEGLELEAAMFAEITAAGEQADEPRIQDFLCLVREMQGTMRVRTQKDYAPELWAKVKPATEKIEADRVRAEQLLQKRHGDRGSTYARQFAVLDAFYKKLGSFVNRDVPRLDLMTDHQLVREWHALVGRGLSASQKMEPGYKLMKTWADQACARLGLGEAETG